MLEVKLFIVSTRALVALLAVCASLSNAASPSVTVPWTPAAYVVNQSTPLAVAEPPAWTFAIYNFEDPYEGDIQQPDIPGTHVVGAEIEIINHSNRSLTIYLNNLRIHTDDELTYPAGTVIGNPVDEDRLTPKLVEGVVEGNDAVRGWVWWRIPDGVRLVDVRFFPSPPPPSIIELPVSP